MRRRDFRPAGAIDGFLYAVLQIASYKLDARGTGTTSGQGTCGIFHPAGTMCITAYYGNRKTVQQREACLLDRAS
jgi:hypothetical protein